MATWNSRGLRGSTLEEMINRSNEHYAEKRLGLIQKIPTPITPINIDKESRHITLAYFDQKSTVDYIGAVQSYPVCFDAKECRSDNFPLQNIHEHQVRFMEAFEQQGGIAFMLIWYSQRNELYYLTFREMMKYWDRKAAGGRKHFKFEELDPHFFLPTDTAVLVPYLEGIRKDLEQRNIEG